MSVASSERRLPKALIESLKARLVEERARLVKGLRERPLPVSGGRELVEATSDLIDSIVLELADAATTEAAAVLGEEAHRLAESIAVVALGGYGRRELCPSSDIDLLFLIPAAGGGTPAAELFVNLVLYGLWDLGLEVGHAARTVSECLDAAKVDQSIKTGLLESRLIARSAAPQREELFRELERAVDRELLAGRAAELLISQKLVEAARRRERYGNTIYLLEPDVKHGEGGLRDLHAALWIARARWRARTIKDLLRVGVLSPRESRALERAYGFLIRVRSELHLAAKRRRDSLGFEYQEAIAETLGYIDDGETDRTKRQHGTERFMRAYYFHARQNHRISAMVIERAGSAARGRPVTVISAPGGFKLFGGKLTVVDREQIAHDPAALLRIFRVAQEESLEIYSYTKDLIVESLAAIDQKARRDPAVLGTFLSILEDAQDGGEVLGQMLDLGIIRRLIPEFGRITARWQHSLYHVYTVDVHSQFVVKTLKRIRRGDHAKEHPELTRLFAELPRPAVLYLAALLHDIGKGWTKGDHSIRGAKVAEIVGKRFEISALPGWTSEETEDLVWLVEQHLLMSGISQRRDLSDQELIESFAAQCRSVERLTMLYLLTVADMKSTSPKIWTDWKGILLHELYEKAKAVLSDPSRSAAIDPAAHLEARRRRAVQEILEAFDGFERPRPSRGLVEAFTRAMPPRYLLSMTTKRMAEHLDPWREVSERGDLSIHIRHQRKEETTELTVVAPDRPGLLSLLAGVLTANRLTILGAQVFSIDLAERREGSGTPVPSGKAALDLLYLRDSGGGICEEPERWEQVRADLRAVVLGSKDVEALLDQRVRGSRLAKRPKPSVETKVVVLPDASRTETVVDVFCQDHLGALYTISRAFAEQGLTIRLAKISTFGEQVADGFYVADAATGLKIEDEPRQKAIAEAVKAAIDGALAS